VWRTACLSCGGTFYTRSSAREFRGLRRRCGECSSDAYAAAYSAKLAARYPLDALSPGDEEGPPDAPPRTDV
jgi:hypothetical protein